MKKIILSALALLSLSSCYDDYVKDYDFNTVYFAKQINTRTVVVGEGQKIKIGAVLAGVMENKKNRNVHFEFDNSLANADVLSKMKGSEPYIKEAVSGVKELKPLPADYFTLSNDETIVIPKGDHLGTIDLQVTDKFISDPATLKATYVLPLKIISADVDSINQSKSTTVIGLHYENTLFGNYYHSGVAEKTTPDGQKETIVYHGEIPQPEKLIWKLSTVSPNSLISNQIIDGTVAGKLKITLNEDGSIQIGSVEGSPVEVKADGASSFNKAKLLQDRQLFLKYKFEDASGNSYQATDTLTFRNRIRDGVNEWKDENPEHYN